MNSDSDIQTVDLARSRERMVQVQIARRGIRDSRCARCHAARAPRSFCWAWFRGIRLRGRAAADRWGPDDLAALHRGPNDRGRRTEVGRSGARDRCRLRIRGGRDEPNCQPCVCDRALSLSRRSRATALLQPGLWQYRAPGWRRHLGLARSRTIRCHSGGGWRARCSAVWSSSSRSVAASSSRLDRNGASRSCWKSAAEARRNSSRRISARCCSCHSSASRAGPRTDDAPQAIMCQGDRAGVPCRKWLLERRSHFPTSWILHSDNCSTVSPLDEWYCWAKPATARQSSIEAAPRSRGTSSRSTVLRSWLWKRIGQMQPP